MKPRCGPLAIAGFAVAFFVPANRQPPYADYSDRRVDDSYRTDKRDVSIHGGGFGLGLDVRRVWLNSVVGGSSREDRRECGRSDLVAEDRSCPRNCWRRAETKSSLGQPGKAVEGRDPQARRPAATGALIGAGRAGKLVRAKNGSAEDLLSIHQGLRRLRRPDWMEMVPC